MTGSIEGDQHEPTQGDLVELVEVETVVRLDTPGEHLAELVLTGDVAASLSAVLEAACETGGGAGFFVVGPFGSGKSHFLSALGQLLSGAATNGPPASWDLHLRDLAKTARRCLAVRVPLVEYRSLASLEDVVAERAWLALDEPRCASGTNRLTSWNTVLDAAISRGHEGMVLLVDELSEFLRAKQGAALTEDLRFLQFLGEWARDHPVIVVAALQENIEEVANVSQRELARIRDRFRPSLTLTMRHVEDLVRGRLVRLRPGADVWVARAWERLSASFPMANLTRERFERCYPLHPQTLSVLEGLRFVLSQQRGVVDFVSQRLRVSSDRTYSDLITPDEVFDHFRSRLLERTETSRLAEVVVPYFERNVGELVDEDDVELALRAVKLMCLLAASPLERPRGAAELGYMLVSRVSDLDPAANMAYLAAAVLDPLAGAGAYVVSEPDEKGEPTYRVELDTDTAVVAASRVAQARAELRAGDRRVVATLVELGSTPRLPIQLIQEVGMARREVLWHNTLRSVVVAPARVLDLTFEEALRLTQRAREIGAEGCLVVGEIETEDAAGAAERGAALAGVCDRLAVWVPGPLLPDELEALLDLHARRTVIEQSQAQGRNDLVGALSRSYERDSAMCREILRRAYYEGSLSYPSLSRNDERIGGADEHTTITPAVAPDLPSLSGLAFERQLATLVDPLLSALHPLHIQVAPRGELVGERITRQLVTEIIAPGKLGRADLDRRQVRSLVEGYLVPLGLARLRRDAMTISPDPARSPAVAAALEQVGDGEPVPTIEVIRALGDGPVGLSEPEALLVLNACIQSGLLEARRGRQRLAEPFLVPGRSDRLSPGELVEPSVREAVERLAPICGPGPFDLWTAGAQRRAWEQASAWLSARREDAAGVRAGLERFGEVPALSEAEPGPVLSDLELIDALIEHVEQGTPDEHAAAGGRNGQGTFGGQGAFGGQGKGRLRPSPAITPPVGLRRLAGAVSDVEAVLGAARRLAALARFVRDDLKRVEEAATYLRHLELTIPSDDVALLTLQASALESVRCVLSLAAEERLETLFSTVRDFRSAYLAAYQEAHDRYYSAVGPADVEAITASPSYRALAALSSIGAIAVPDDRVKVDRLVASSTPRPCRRVLDLELAWKPRCSCGYALGDREPRLDAEATLELAQRGVSEYLAELASADTASRLEQAAADLEQLGRSELAGDLRSLLELAQPAGAGQSQPMDSAGAERVAALLEGGLSEVIRDVLSGGLLIVRRDLAELRENVIGRRYPKRKLLEIVSSWIDPEGTLPHQGFVEIIDSSEPNNQSHHGDGGPGDFGPASSGLAGVSSSSPNTTEALPQSPTANLLARRFPGLASVLPAHMSAEAFWLAAWWRDRPAVPPWIPTGLLADSTRLAAATDAALTDDAAIEELSRLDARIGPSTVLGDQVARALEVSSRSTADLARELRNERLLRYPVRLVVDQLVLRIAGDWELASHLAAAIGGLADRHCLVRENELRAATHLLDAAQHLAAIERGLPEASLRQLVEDLYASHGSQVPLLLGKAAVAAFPTAPDAMLSAAGVEAFEAAARRTLGQLDELFCSYSPEGFPGCLMIWEVGEKVIAPLLAAHGRVAVVLVDALRADLSRIVSNRLRCVVPARPVNQHWAVVPSPTRTKEALAAMGTGRPVPAGSPEKGSWASAVPFSHLGYEAALVVGADRDHQSDTLADLWRCGPPLSVAVATGVDERLHRTSVDLAGLVEETTSSLSRRLVPSLALVPSEVPIVLLADHGFRENRHWGHGPEGRYVHGGTSLEECVVPVTVFEPAPPR